MKAALMLSGIAYSRLLAGKYLEVEVRDGGDRE